MHMVWSKPEWDIWPHGNSLSNHPFLIFFTKMQRSKQLKDICYNVVAQKSSTNKKEQQEKGFRAPLVSNSEPRNRTMAHGIGSSWFWKQLSRLAALFEAALNGNMRLKNATIVDFWQGIMFIVRFQCCRHRLQQNNNLASKNHITSKNRLTPMS